MANKLESYLEAIEECPDELVALNQGKDSRQVSRLTADFGISDYWPINLKVQMEFMMYYFRNCQRYNSVPKKHLIHKDRPMFISPGKEPIGIQVTPWIYDEYLTGNNKEKQDAREKYNMGILILADNPIEGEGAVETSRGLANVIQDISRWIVSQNIPAMLPRTTGWKYGKPEDSTPMIVNAIGRKRNGLHDRISLFNPWLPTVNELLEDKEQQHGRSLYFPSSALS